VEEKLLEQKAYPDLSSHQAEHSALTNKVLAFNKDFDADIVNIPRN
jgi:hemerythrin